LGWQLVVGNMVVDNGHIAAADSSADIAHAVVVAYNFMLIVGISFTDWGGIPFRFVSSLFVWINQ